MKLTAANLEHLPLPAPSYDRSAVTPGIVHFGVGGFHRAHQAVFIDRILASEPEWGIVGVGLLPRDQATSQAAAEQDSLYTLTALAPNGAADTQILGSILEVIYAPDNPEAVMDVLVAPTTRIVSLTITEGGYGIDDATGQFSPTDQLTLADLEGGEAPRSVWGYIATALLRRRASGAKPFTVVSCDNIQGNGEVTRLALTSFVRSSDPELADWITDNVAFPSSMVDRITPTPTAELPDSVRRRVGIEDAWPVQSESFLQWVLEDDFSAGRPRLEQVGVQVVDDVAPYERMKLRLLNASHQAMGYLGILAGFDLVDEACNHPAFASFLVRYMRNEAVPTLGEVPGVDLNQYSAQLMERFSSQAVRDTLARQVVNGSDRVPKFLLPVLGKQLLDDGPIECIALVLAGWSRYLEGYLAPQAGPLADRRAGELLEAVAREAEAPGAFLRYRPVFGDLGEVPRLVDEYLAARRSLENNGALATVEALRGTE